MPDGAAIMIAVKPELRDERKHGLRRGSPLRWAQIEFHRDISPKRSVFIPAWGDLCAPRAIIFA
jgi:hypothetical protein